MTMIPKQSGSFSVKKGDIIFSEGKVIQALTLLLQGKADIFITPFDEEPLLLSTNSKRQFFRICSMDQSIFLSGCDIFLTGSYSYSCKASEGSSLYAFEVKNIDEFKALISSQKDYGAYIMNSLCTLVESSYSSLSKLKSHAAALRILTENLTTYFWALKEKYNLEFTPGSGFLREGLDNLQSLKDAKYQIFDNNIPMFFEKDLTDITNSQAEKTLSDLTKIEYFEQLGKLPTELRKSFFSADPAVTCYHCSDAAEFLDCIITEIRECFIDIRHIFTKLYTDSNECIFSAYLRAIKEIAAAGSNPAPVFEILDYIISRIQQTMAFYECEYLHVCDTDIDYIKCTYANIKASASGSKSAPGSNSAASSGTKQENIPEELVNSARKLVEYSEIAAEKANQFLTDLFAFRNLPDRLTTTEEIRDLRNAITKQFFEIYEIIFKKAYASNEKSRLVDMFLLFGYMDEKLLTTEQVLTLYRLAGKQDELSQGSVYTIKDWLTAIYEKRREPSISEFGQDYNDIFRDLKKRKLVTDKDKIKYDNDIDAKLKHEVTNLFRINQSLCNGQINLYLPVLYSEIITRDLSKALVTAETINESIKRILELDYSAFHREVNFRDPVKGIEKEQVMKPVLPDIILIPTFGCRSVMWQEIALRNRSNPGRFTLPIFTDEILDDMVLKLIGNFRWELCRTVMGSAWNDITLPSLTSEYSDYVQFFKKNKDLTDDAKVKLKAQIQKYHGKTRDIFTADYEVWIKYESKGGVRLNKVVRSIMYRYCPLVKPLRDQLEKLPIYSDIAVKYNIGKKKITKELEGRYGKYAKSGPLDPDLEHNLQFYRDM